MIKSKMATENLGIRELARKIGVSHPTVSEVVTYGNMPSFNTCATAATHTPCKSYSGTPPWIWSSVTYPSLRSISTKPTNAPLQSIIGRSEYWMLFFHQMN
jgi:hypothetical protein